MNPKNNSTGEKWKTGSVEYAAKEKKISTTA